MNAKSKSIRVMVVGESWVKHTVHLKGFDQFHSTEFEEGATRFLNILKETGLDVTYVRAHEVSSHFPSSIEELKKFDVIVISDIGSNSFLLTDATFLKSKRVPNLLRLVSEFVQGGGGLVMVGGYLSFTGIDGRARYGMSPLAEVLPVSLLDHDDRIEVPEGLNATVVDGDHPALGQATSDWPILLGYNRFRAKAGSTTLVEHGEDPILVVGQFGRGRTVAFASDLAPHWAPREFLEWSYYPSLWSSIVNWAGSAESL